MKKLPCPTNLAGCLKVRDRDARQCVNCYKEERRLAMPSAQVQTDRDKQRVLDEKLTLQRKYKEAIKVIERQDQELGALKFLGQNTETFTIAPKKGNGTSEGTAVIVASDWHIEENVGSEVGGLNVFNVDIAKARIQKFFQGAERLIKLLKQDINIPTIILALLGDFITNDIHATDKNELLPTNAIVLAQNEIISGIEFLLEHTGANMVIPCHSGNHARTTKKTQFESENGHSLEYLMYLHLAAYFRNEPRVQFIIADGMHSYVKVYDTTIRFQHGHAIKYGGGVGGIYIPVNKSIAQWDRAKPADLNVFGHFHTFTDGGNFIANGSLIGYSSYALSIKASFEKPKQALFLLDRKRGKTCVWPILLD